MVQGGWQSFPAAYKKRTCQGVLAYGLLLAAMAAYGWAHAANSEKEWHSRIPFASASIKAVYLTPQLTDAPAATGFDNEAGMPAPPAAGSGGTVSIIITGLGLSAASTDRALQDMPPPVALAFSPYSAHLDEWIKKATKAQRDALVLLPMQPSDFPREDPGPKALLTRQSVQENTDDLFSILSAAKGVVGIMNYMGSAFMTDPRKMEPVMGKIKDAGKTIFIENPGPGDLPAAGDTAKQADVPYLSVDEVIDANASEADIRQNLFNLEKIAREKGHAIGVAHPYPLTFNLIKSWADTLDKRGIKLVPVTSLTPASPAGAEAPKSDAPKSDK